MVIDNEFKSLIPALTEDERQGLEASLKVEGCRDALVLWGNILIDGHNRYEICTQYGIPYKTVQKDFADRDEAKEWMILNQFGRRNINAYQRSVLALQLKSVFADRAKENQLSTLKQNCTVSQKSVERIDTQKELAKIANVSHDTIAKVERIEAIASDETKDALRRGEISINKAYQDVRREEKKQEVQKRISEHAKVQTGAIDLRKTDRKYNIIYADPPWRYWESGNKNQALHYTTMSIDEICDLPVKDIADENCVLFLWVTYPILQEAFKVVEAWGFNYSTCAFVWVKKNKQKDTPFVGCGAWTRANSELCLLATKGNVMRLDASISQVVESPNCVSVRKTGVDLDKKGVDYVATLDNGAEIYIDVKRRRKGTRAIQNGEPVLVIETWSVFPRKVGGTYSRTTPVDMILYLFDPEEWQKFYLVPFQHLRMASINHYYEWKERYTEKHQRNSGWLSKAMFVPASVVLSAVADEMTGALYG